MLVCVAVSKCRVDAPIVSEKGVISNPLMASLPPTPKLTPKNDASRILEQRVRVLTKLSPYTLPVFSTPLRKVVDARCDVLKKRRQRECEARSRLLIERCEICGELLLIRIVFIDVLPDSALESKDPQEIGWRVGPPLRAHTAKNAVALRAGHAEVRGCNLDAAQLMGRSEVKARVPPRRKERKPCALRVAVWRGRRNRVAQHAQRVEERREMA